MSKIGYQSQGMGSLIRDMDGYISELNKEISFAIADNLEKTQLHAKKNHRFKSRRSKLEQSVQVEQNRSGNTHTAKIFLNDKVTTTAKDKSYGSYIHEGTYQGYSQSPIAQPYKNSISKSGKGWKADPFLWRAIERKWHLTRDLKLIEQKLKKKYERV